MNSRTKIAGIPFFTLDLPWLNSEYEALRRLGTSEMILTNLYRWTFPLNHLDAVSTALNGMIIQFDKGIIMKEIIPRCDPILQQMQVDMAAKGQGELVIALRPEGYMLTWWQRGVEKHKVVSRGLVEKIWFDVILQKMKVGEKKRSRKLAEWIIRALEKHHWDTNQLFYEKVENDEIQGYVCQGRWNHNRSGNFNYKYFNGDRANYFGLFYYPIKVLQAMGLIEHTRGGDVIRLGKDSEFEAQTKFYHKRLIIEERERELADARKNEKTIGEKERWLNEMK